MGPYFDAQAILDDAQGQHAAALMRGAAVAVTVRGGVLRGDHLLRHDRSRAGGDDHDGRHPRDGLCAQSGKPRDLHGSGPHCRGCAKEDFFGKPRSELAQQFLSKILQH